MPLSKERLTVLVTLWGVAIALSLVWVWQLKDEPSVVGAVAAQFPPDVVIRRAPAKPVLLMFAHPHCPCTRASLRELAKLLDDAGSELDPHVVFFSPTVPPAGWKDDGLWGLAKQIAGLDIVRDVDGELAREFGVTTSGQVLLYDATGALIFHGGLTAARGQEGNSPAAKRILAYVEGAAMSHETTPVFGCALAGGMPERALVDATP